MKKLHYPTVKYILDKLPDYEYKQGAMTLRIGAIIQKVLIKELKVKSKYKPDAAKEHG